jgi:hypothetical protein
MPGEGEQGGGVGDRAEAGQNYLGLVGVGVLSHDPLIVQDVLEGLAGKTPARSTHR